MTDASPRVALADGEAYVADGQRARRREPEAGVHAPPRERSAYVPASPIGLTMDWLQRITVNPAQCGGRPCIRGMRIRVQDVLDLLAAGLTRDGVVSELPDLELADVDAALRYASARFDHPILLAA